MKLSRSAPGAGVCAASKAVRRPAASRSTVNTGCTTSRMLDAALGELAEDRIDEERHVVVDDLKHRVAASALGLPWLQGPLDGHVGVPGLRSASKDQASAASAASSRAS